tara:strand:+ start:72 stop:374 length:303 start_codon:yes stop_codon:yes gene_type:complete
MTTELIIAILTVVLTGLTKKAAPSVIILSVISSTQLISWLTALAVTFIGGAVGLITIDTSVWWVVVLKAVATGLVANGIWTVPFIQKVLVAIGLEKAPAA